MIERDTIYWTDSRGGLNKMSVKDYENNREQRAIIDERLGFLARGKTNISSIPADGGTGKPTSPETKEARDGMEVAAGEEKAQTHDPQPIQGVEEEVAQDKALIAQALSSAI